MTSHMRTHCHGGSAVGDAGGGRRGHRGVGHTPAFREEAQGAPGGHHSHPRGLGLWVS